MLDSTNSTSLTNVEVGFGNTNIDWSQISTAFLMQYVPATIGPPNNLLNNLVLGPSLTLTGLTLVDGQQNAITDTLLASPTASINLSVPGASDWAPLLTNAAPSAPIPFGSALLISAQMYVTQGLATGGVPFSPIVGISPLLGGTQFLTLAGTAETGIAFNTEGCSGTGFTTLNPTAAQPAITTDTDFGTLQYGDPFPSAWARTISLCQESTAAIPIPDSSATATFILTDTATVAPSNTPLAPVVLPVQSPTINGGGSIFGATVLNSTIVTLNWTAPAGTVPFGYAVRTYVQTTAGGLATYAATGAAFSTSSTSITLPPLAGGNTYVFSITADADGTANMQTSPFRSSLPTGYATVVSGPVTISSSAQTPEIHGDRRVSPAFAGSTRRHRDTEWSASDSLEVTLMNLSLHSKVALITGGSRGIGAAAVRMFVAAGAKVIFNYQAAKAQADDLVHECGAGNCRAVQSDLSSTEAAQQLVRPRSRLSGDSIFWSRITVSGRPRMRPLTACPMNNGIVLLP